MILSKYGRNLLKIRTSLVQNTKLQHDMLRMLDGLLPSSEQANHDFLGEDICTLRRSTCRGIVSKLRYSKYDKGQKRKYRKHLEGGEGSCRDCIARRRLAESSSTASSTASLSVPALSMPASTVATTEDLINQLINNNEQYNIERWCGRICCAHMDQSLQSAHH
jgi:hypothetical protein